MALRKKTSLILTYLMALLLATFWVSDVAAKTNVKVKAIDQGSVGRFVLDWGRNQPFSAELEDGYLYVRFTKPFTADLAVVSNVLSRYVGKGEFLEGEQSVRFPLKGNIQLAANTNGTEIQLDLKKPLKAPSGGAVKIRSGEHADFSRVVFDWPKKAVAYSSRQDGDKLFITFQAEGEINTAVINGKPPKFVRSVSTKSVNGKTEVIILLESGTGMTSFTNEKSVVFDMRKQAVSKQSAEKKQPVAEKPQVAAVKPVKVTEKPLPVQPEVRTASVPEKKDEKTLTVKPVEEKIAIETTKAPAIKQEATPVAPQKDAVTVDELARISPSSGSAIAAIGPTIILDPEDEPVSVAPVTTPVEAPKPVKVKKAEPVKQEVIASPSEKLKVEIANLKDGFRLIFPWEDAAAMAMFDHNGVYWVVFDRAVKADFSNLAGPYKFLVSHSSQLPTENGTVLRFNFRKGYTPAVSKVNDDWHVDFQLSAKAELANPIDVQTQPASLSGTRVFIPAINNGKDIRFHDASSGFEITAVPLNEAGWGLNKTQNFEKLVVLETVQGVALFATDAEIDIAAEQNGVSVTAVSEQSIIRTEKAKKPERKIARPAGSTPLFNKAEFVKLEEWRQVRPYQFTERKQELQKQAAAAGPKEKLNSLLTLARFYVGHGFFADSKGVLHEIRSRFAKMEKDREFRLLRGLSDLGLHHLKAAEHHLYHPDFDGDVEVAPWRGVVAAALKDWERAARDLAYGAGAFGVFDKETQNRFNLLRARAALEDFDTELAQETLALVKDPASAFQKSEKALLEGLVSLQLSDLPAASKKFSEAIALGYRPVVEETRFVKVNSELEEKKISPKEAISALEKLDFAWRGDELEVNIQKRLGDLYVATGRISDGLDTYKRIVRNFPESPYSKDLGRKMNDIFAQLFLEGAADKLPPIKALAIYYQYRELTPVGKKGDKMIRILADRLARVDLLEQSAQLLEHQINFRLKGLDRANAGTKLAVVHLWNGKPQESLRVLYETRWRKLSPEVKRERIYIEARAQTGLENFEQALALIENDRTSEANSLRAEIYWKAKDWPNAIPALEKLIGNNGSDKTPDLDKLDRQRIMQLAVARSLMNDKRGIRQMRQDYRAKMEGTSDLTAFDLITEQNDPSAAEFRERATIIAQVGQLESFMAGYREKLENGEFWATY
ncbi:MAG: hypothetical protein NXI13_01955 [Proteobacteria bacterium]|nr:hypothetical protein [Pseudomonadota bacterium]